MGNVSDNVEELASEIAKNSNLGSFPEDYLPLASGEKREIPVGLEVIMFRQDEYIVVSIDSERIYLRTNDEAKYVFYSAKRGRKYISDPAGLDLHTAISRFETDLDETQRAINVVSKGWNDIRTNALKSLCSKLLGYNDIF